VTTEELDGEIERAEAAHKVSLISGKKWRIAKTLRALHEACRNRRIKCRKTGPGFPESVRKRKRSIWPGLS